MNIDFNSITDMDAATQLQIIQDLEAQNKEAQNNVNAQPDMMKLIEAEKPENYSEQNWLAAYHALTSETKEASAQVSENAKEIKALKFHLYTESPHHEVRSAMETIVDEFISEKFDTQRLIGREPNEGEPDNRTTELNFYHELLHLSTFGGRITRERPDCYHIAYEFNVLSDEGYQPAVPWNPMEKLYEDGMLVKYDEDTVGNNLSPIGKAVLARLNDNFGEPEGAATYTTPVQNQRRNKNASNMKR